MERAIDSHIPYLYVDASYFKVREGIKYVNKALLVVVGVRTMDTGKSWEQELQTQNMNLRGKEHSRT
jgi:transposase-like protein